MSFSLEDQYQQFLYPMEADDSPQKNIYTCGDKKSVAARPAQNIKILLTSNASKPNKKLLKYFKQNLQPLNKAGLVFNWIVVYEDEMDLYEDQGITSFPVLIHTETIVGVADIIDYLDWATSEKKIRSQPQQKRKKINRPPKEYNDEDDVRNYLLDEMRPGDDEDLDEDEVFQKTITQRIAAMNKVRSTHGQHTISMSNPEIHERNARAASRQHNYGFDRDPETEYKRPPSNRQISPRDNNLAPRTKNTQAARGDPVVAAAELASRGNNSLDDTMSLNYWQNQEETPM